VHKKMLANERFSPRSWIDNMNVRSITWTGTQGEMDFTKENGGQSFVPIAAKWLASGTDDDDDDDT